jgi:hypothetical protein
MVSSSVSQQHKYLTYVVDYLQYLQPLHKVGATVMLPPSPIPPPPVVFSAAAAKSVAAADSVETQGPPPQPQPPPATLLGSVRIKWAKAKAKLTDGLVETRDKVSVVCHRVARFCGSAGDVKSMVMFGRGMGWHGVSGPSPGASMARSNQIALPPTHAAHQARHSRQDQCAIGGQAGLCVGRPGP